MKNLPKIPLVLVEAFEARYPDRCPQPEWTERDIWIAVGEARAAKHLRSLHEAQKGQPKTGQPMSVTDLT